MRGGRWISEGLTVVHWQVSSYKQRDKVYLWIGQESREGFFFFFVAAAADMQIRCTYSRCQNSQEICKTMCPSAFFLLPERGQLTFFKHRISCIFHVFLIQIQKSNNNHWHVFFISHSFVIASLFFLGFRNKRFFLGALVKEQVED